MKSRMLTVVVTLGMVIGGASGASAWTFATRTSPQSAIYNGATFGQGAGNIYRSGFSTVLIDVSLRDPVANGRGVYQNTRVWKPADPGWTGASTSTGRRTVNSWAAMKQQSINTVKSSVGSWARSKVCEDAPLRPDICSTDRSGAL